MRQASAAAQNNAPGRIAKFNERKSLQLISGWFRCCLALSPQPSFEQFATSLGSEDDFMKAENSLGNLVLHALQSLELHYRWKEKIMSLCRQSFVKTNGVVYYMPDDAPEWQEVAAPAGRAGHG